MKRRSLHIATALLVCCGLALAAYVGEKINRERFATAERAEALHDLTAVRDALESNLNSDIQLVRGLLGVIALEPGINQERFELAAQSLFSGRTQLRNIAAAPDMVIRLMYPLQGNEKAIGLDFRQVPAQFATAEQARVSRQIVLAGPLNLVQGGVGLVARMPVYLPDSKGGEYFWGLVSAVIDAEKLFASSGLGDAKLPVDIAIRGKDAKGVDGEVFFGRPELFGANPVLASIHLPQGTWEIAATPRGGWSAEPDNQGALRLGFALIAFMVASAFLILWRALLQASRATERAESSRRQLSATLENTPNVAIQWFDAQGLVTYWNRASEQLYGWRQEEVRGKCLDELILGGEEAARWRSALAALNASGQSLGPSEYVARTRTGEARWVESTAFLIPGDDEAARILVCMDVDITNRKLAEKKVAEFNRDFEAFLNQTTDFVYFKDAESRFRFCSQTMADITGYDHWRPDRQARPGDLSAGERPSLRGRGAPGVRRGETFAGQD